MATAILNASAPARNSGRLVSIGEAAALANVNPQTIRRYMESGLVEGLTTPGGHRRVNLSSVADAFGVALPETGESPTEGTGRMVVVYARVSTQKQKAEGNLARQVERLTAYCAEHYAGQTVRIIQEVGSGLSDQRPGFLKLVELLAAGRVSTLVCEYRDRIARFGVGVVQRLCEAHQTAFVESRTGDEQEHAVTAEQEMAKDVLAILAVYSNRAMGKRGGAKTKVIPPEGLREKVCALRGAGLSRRAILTEIMGDKPVCQNTGKPIGEWFVRRVLDELAGETPVVPTTIKRFLRHRCTLGVAKKVASNDLFAAYVAETAKPLTRDKFAHFVKLVVPNARFENGSGGMEGMAYGLTLKATA
jgi:predicted site-specific integrase-resolvase